MQKGLLFNRNSIFSNYLIIDRDRRFVKIIV